MIFVVLIVKFCSDETIEADHTPSTDCKYQL